MERMDRLPSDVQQEAWSAVESRWQHRLAEAWGFRCFGRGSNLLTTDLPDAEAAALLQFQADALGRIQRSLQRLGVAEQVLQGLDIAIVCRRVEEYLDYTCDFHPEDHYGSVSSGMCIDAGLVHVVAHGRWDDTLRATLAHEWAHSRLVHLTLPAWLEEGLVMMLEHAIVPYQTLDDSRTRVHLQGPDWWTAERVAAFFDGRLFGGPGDDDGLAYDLSWVIADRLLHDDAERYRRLLLSASYEDDGRSAFEGVHGEALEMLVPTEDPRGG